MGLSMNGILACFSLCLVLIFHGDAAEGLPSKDLHYYMTVKEINKYFGVSDHAHVPDYDVTSPYQSNEAGEFMSYSLHQSRDKRSTDEPGLLSYKLKAFGSNLHLKLRPNKDLMTRHVIINKQTEDGTVTSYSVPKNTFFLGSIPFDPESTVALSNLGGLTGMIQTSRDTLFVHPLPAHLAKHVTSSADATPHLVYKSSLGRGVVKRHKRGSSHEVSGSRYYLEAALVVPLSSETKYGHDYNIQRLLVMANIVAGLFQDASIGNRKIHYVVNKIYVVVPEKLNMTLSQTNVKKLSKMMKWSKKENGDQDLFDAFAFISDGTARGGKSSADSMCRGQSGTAVTDAGLQTAWYIAHGIGHNMGLRHDGGRAECPNRKYLMSTVKVKTSSSYSWSPCSRDRIQAFLANDSWCLIKSTPPTGGPILSPENSGKLPGEIIDGDKQCRDAHGAGFKHTDNKKLRGNCSTLWCQDNSGSILSDGSEVAHGTTCGYRKWCIKGSCVIDSRPIVAGKWSTCSRSCGGGVQHRQSACATPPQQDADGQECQENARDWRICSVKPCARGGPSHRDVQCQKRNAGSRGIIYHLDPCALYCGPHGRRWKKSKLVDEGTRCAKSGFDVCIQGRCQAVGCDHVLGSGAMYDRCRVCNGNGSTCARMSGSFTEQWDEFGPRYARLIMELPAGTLKAKFEEMDSTANIIGVQNAAGYFLSARKGVATPEGRELQAAGGKIVWIKPKTKNSSTDRLKIEGPTNATLRVVLMRNGRQRTRGVRYEYYRELMLGETADDGSFFEWKTTDWSACSASCSSGFQTRKVRCVRSDDKTPANHNACRAEEKPAKNRDCSIQPCAPE